MLQRSLVFGLVVAAAMAIALVSRGVAELASARLPPLPMGTEAPTQSPPAAGPAPRKMLVVADPERLPVPPASPARCAFPSRVVVSAVDPEEPARSVVVLEAFGGKPMLRVGGETGGHRVVAIGSEHTWLRDGATLCYVDARLPAAGGPTAAAVMVTTGQVAGIALADPTHARIDRALRDRLLENHFELMRTLRGGPDLVDGKVVGLRLLGAPPGSVPAALGLRAGDSLRTINGFSLASPEQMLEAFAKLRTAPTLELEIMRGGVKTTLSIEVG